MRVTEISVTKLFGIFDHTIPLNLDDRITIIHGENGFGKTIMLEMFYGLFNEQYSELINVPFQEFRAKFDDDSVLWVEKDHESKYRQIGLFPDEDVDEVDRSEEAGFPKVTVSFSKAGVLEPYSFPLTFPFNYQKAKIFLSSIDEDIPELKRVDPRKWIYSPTGETLSLVEVLERFFPWRRVLPKWLIKLRETIEIHLIQTQRLQSVRENDRESIGSRSSRRISMVPTVDEYAKELRDIIRQKHADSASSSQSLYSTFPTRLVELMSDPNRPVLTDDDLQTRLSKLDKKRSRLEEIGILDKEGKEVGVVSLSPEKMVGDTKEVLTLYIQDMEEKLGVFNEIADKIGLFKEMIDKRFLYKSIAISSKTGFTFIAQNGEPLSLTALSSGEQHELVLLYQLLFRTKPNSLILIDEPEISLHVAWQQIFLQDLQEITRLASFDVLMATHSPSIIHDRWDLTVRLEEPAIL